jgi:hypothetical protein
MGEMWFRGQSSVLAPSSPGGSIHDFGDGMYLTDSRQVAELYAETRVSKGGGKAEVLMIRLERSELGRVLDLDKDPRWERFLKTPQVPKLPHTTPANLIKLANENYGRLFQEFVRSNRIQLQHYDAVIGPEYVRGGSQLCILHRDGKPSSLNIQLRARLQPVGTPLPNGTRVEFVSGSQLVQRATRQGVVGNQAAMAMIGTMVGGAIQSIGDVGIRWRVEKALQTTHAQAIATILGRGDGALVVIRMQEWIIPDWNGQRARSLIGVSVQGGPTEAEALRSWRATPRIMNGPALGWRSYEQYAWIAPSK